MSKNLREIWSVFRMESISQLRDKSTLRSTILIPIFLYPVLFWVMGQIMTLRAGVLEKELSRVVLVGSELAPGVAGYLEDVDKVELTLAESAGEVQLSPETADLIVRIQSAILDPKRLCYRVDLIYDGAEDRSNTARGRIETALSDLNDDLIVAAYERSVGRTLVRATVDPVAVNTASSEEMVAFLTAMIIPMMIIIMVGMGVLTPAIDVMVGERERQTLETTLLSPIARRNIILGKFSVVVCAGLLATTLNLLSLGLLARHTMLGQMLDEGDGFSLPLSAIPLIFFATLLVSIFFSAVMMVIASFARTFREGQSFVTPFFIISYQPAIISALPGIKLTMATAFIPVANVSLMFKALISGEFPMIPILITFVSLFIYCVPPIWLGTRLLNNERLLWGQLQASFWENFRSIGLFSSSRSQPSSKSEGQS